MSSKTEVLSFDIDEYNSRECQVHNHGFYLGEQSKQAEVDKLQTDIDYLQNKYDAMYRAFIVADDCRKEWHRCYVSIRQREDELQKRVKELELINFDSELHFDAAKEHIDHLQKRIDKAMELLEYNEYVDSTLQALEILKGEQTK